jgi:poly(hydroxyalkanoate) depolymerase family esterase
MGQRHTLEDASMARRLSRLFFANVRRMTRLQRALIKLARPSPIRSKPKRAAAAPKAKASPRTGPAAARPDAGQEETGAWRSGVHRAVLPGATLPVRLAYSCYLPPAGLAAGMPLVVMLHGCQQTAADIARGSRMNRLADARGFAVLYPQQSLTRQPHRCWRWFQPDARAGLLEADAIASLIQAFTAAHGLDAGRVFIAGLSAGAGMAAIVALRHPQLIRAVGLHSGAVLGDARSARAGLATMRIGASQDPHAILAALALPPVSRMPALILHGRQDSVVALRNAHQLVSQFQRINHLDAAAESVTTMLASGRPNEYRRTDYRRGRETLVRLCEITHLNHAWSGGDSAVKFFDRKGPDASALLWRFFASHCRAVA